MNGIEIPLVFIAGFALGLCYFGGLWWTVKRLSAAGRPLAFYLASFAARLAIILTCVILVLQAGTWHLLVAVAGFFMARFFLVYRSTRPNSAPTRTRTIR